MYINKAILYGNLTRDPELKALPSGAKVVEFGMATNRVYKDKEGNNKEEAEFHNIVSFGRQAEVIAQYLKKGSPIFLEGRIRTRNWEAKDGSGKRYKTEIVIDRFQFGPRPAGAGGGGNWQSPHRRPAEEAGVRSASAEAHDQNAGETIQYPEEDIKPEDIPF
ncbi:MAG: single-strand DNA-binding protein [Parcubacteria group bacterium Gr01-1014_17]|nr:MAG: single-strand DNA-binding protein [Parcubacteria group bacterium Gr01-1014_17]